MAPISAPAWMTSAHVERDDAVFAEEETQAQVERDRRELVARRHSGQDGQKSITAPSSSRRAPLIYGSD